jgi:glycosyltransferase involved in cell wall biosynthesis
MILLTHNFKEVSSIIRNDSAIPFNSRLSIAKNVYTLALQFPNEIIIWSQLDATSTIDLDYCKTIFQSGRSMRSYNPLGNYLPDSIGYVEASPFIKVSKKVIYPTWQMSSLVGGMNANVIVQTNEKFWDNTNFDYCLNSIAKNYQPLGLFCYSDPNLLKGTTQFVSPEANFNQLFKFVKQHYKATWVYLLLLNIMLHDKKAPLLAVVNTFFVKRPLIKKASLYFDEKKIIMNVVKETIDVIIPTIGRKKYLYDVLCDLKAQTHLPVCVIIVEQNPLPESVSELEYIDNEQWPFEIKHIFTRQPGACNARNLALKEVKSKWVFLADDDIRFTTTFTADSFESICKLKANAITLSCLQKHNTKTLNTIFQWNSFGSGCSIVNAELLKACHFDMGYEYGFGEDSDFGMQLRNMGNDVLYLPQPEILHLKAPLGGFRTKPVLKWSKDVIQPKPSPTVMLYKVKHNTRQQILGYKAVLFFKYYKTQKIKNPIRYNHYFQKQWKQSLFWANELTKVK